MRCDSGNGIQTLAGLGFHMPEDPKDYCRVTCGLVGGRHKHRKSHPSADEVVHGNRLSESLIALMNKKGVRTPLGSGQWPPLHSWHKVVSLVY